MYQATRLFISNLNARLAQRFLSLVLLPHVRQDVREHQRLHFALFQALKKAAYKPDAFYKARAQPGAAQQDLPTAHALQCQRMHLTMTCQQCRLRQAATF